MSVVGKCTAPDDRRRTLFTGKFPRLLPVEERMSLQSEKDLFIWITVDETMDMASCISWRDRQFFRFSISECKQVCAIPMDVVFGIGECEMMADACAIVIWGRRQGTTRHIILRTDNQNAFHWISKSQSKDGKSNRILQKVLVFLLEYGIEIIAKYLRSAHIGVHAIYPLMA